MTRRRAQCVFPCLVSAAVLAAGLASGQEAEPPITLKHSAVKGDSMVVDTVAASHLAVDLNGPGQQPTNLEISHGTESTYREQVLAAGNGRATMVKRTWSANRVNASFGAVNHSGNGPLHGKSMTLKRVGSKVQIITPVKMDATTRTMVERNFLGSPADLLPKTPVRVGAAWRPDPKLAARYLAADTAALRCVLAEITEFEGQRAARIEISGRMSVRVPELPNPIRIEMHGEMHHSLDINRVLQIDVGGPVNTSGRMTRNGVTRTMRGEGDFQQTSTVRWVKIAGKPVPAQ